MATIDWQNSIKYHAASELVDRMAARPDLYHDDLLALFREVANFVDFSHLKRCEDPKQKNMQCPRVLPAVLKNQPKSSI